MLERNQIPFRGRLLKAALTSLIFAHALAVLPAHAQPASSTAMRCAALAKSKLPGLEITSTKLVAPIPAGTIPILSRGPSDKIEAAFPAHCRVEGVINRRKGADGVEYGIRFALAMPGSWNGRLLYQGGGGFNGSVADPYGMTAAGDEPALMRGFAVISTDSGHKGAVFDTAFLRDQQAALDFAFNAVPLVTRLGKDIATRYYGRSPHHTYSVGCSTGGREGMLAAQRYPDLFDGVIAGDPAMRSWGTRIAGWNAWVAFNRIAPRDADGKPLTTQAFTTDDHQLLYAAVADRCDALDGLKDGMILNPGACHFDPAGLQCRPGQSSGCLTEGKVAALRTAFGGPKDSRGNPVYPGYPYDLGMLGGHVPMTLIPAGFGYTPYTDPPDPFLLDVDAAVRRAAADPAEALEDTFYWVDLGTFFRRGGKIMFYHGTADPWYSIYDTQDYFERSRAANPEFDSSRFYAVPGMQHCAGGGLERFDMLTALVEWTEHDKAPGPIVATDWKRQHGNRPLCPWPQYAQYKGAGDIKDESNFECRSEVSLSD